MTRTLSLCVRIGDGDGPVVVVRGREAWALMALIASGEQGCTPMDHPGPRWSSYVYDLRKLGIFIDTIRERHKGPFPGEHARYVLRSRITVRQARSEGMKPLPAIRMVVGEDLPSPGPLPQPQRARTTTDGLSATTGGGP